MEIVSSLNLALPGNHRYQPRMLQATLGYDHLYAGVARVELANLQVLGDIGIIRQPQVEAMTELIRDRVLQLKTTDVDAIERTVTKHDIRAWVEHVRATLVAEFPDVATVLNPWWHVPLTSYDPLHTGRILQYLYAHSQALKPSLRKVIGHFADLIQRYASTVQIGRTHGQHALPITVGFWLATILHRVLYVYQQMDGFSDGLVGKISGAVGAYNAQAGLQILERCGRKTFEHRVLEKLGLRPARISTQILPPEPLAFYLFSCTMMTAAFGQFGRDCRQLMRSEIGEVAEEYEEGQEGSSTMGHKRNPKNFENIEGQWLRTKNEFGKVMDSLISEHQRDLVGSSLERDFPIILVNLANQLDTLLQSGKRNDQPFLSRIRISSEACQRNFQQTAHLILAEPLYIALQMAGYPHDAHKLVNFELVPIAQGSRQMLIDVAEQRAATDPPLAEALERITPEVRALLHHPEQYYGLAVTKAIEIAQHAEQLLRK